EGALKLREASYLSAEGHELESILHGPLISLTAEDSVVMVAQPGPALERTTELAAALREIGAATMAVGPAAASLKATVALETPARPPTGFQVAGWLVLFQAGAVLVWAVSFLFTLVPPASCGFLAAFSAGQAAFLFLVFWPVGLLIAVVGAKLRTMRAVITAVIM